MVVDLSDICKTEVMKESLFQYKNKENMNEMDVISKRNKKTVEKEILKT